MIADHTYTGEFENTYPRGVFIVHTYNNDDKSNKIKIFLTQEGAFVAGGSYEKMIPQIKQDKHYDELKMFPNAFVMPIEDADGKTRKDHVWLVTEDKFASTGIPFWHKQNAEKMAEKIAKAMNKKHIVTKFPIEEFL